MSVDVQNDLWYLFVWNFLLFLLWYIANFMIIYHFSWFNRDKQNLRFSLLCSLRNNFNWYTMSSTLSVQNTFAKKSLPKKSSKQFQNNDSNVYMFESTAPSLDLQMRGARTFGSEFICLFPMKSKHRRHSLWCLFLGEQAWEKPFPTRKRSIRFSCFAWQRATTCCLHLLDSVERSGEICPIENVVKNESITCFTLD